MNKTQSFHSNCSIECLDQRSGARYSFSSSWFYPDFSMGNFTVFFCFSFSLEIIHSRIEMNCINIELGFWNIDEQMWWRNSKWSICQLMQIKLPIQVLMGANVLNCWKWCCHINGLNCWNAVKIARSNHNSMQCAPVFVRAVPFSSFSLFLIFSLARHKQRMDEPNKMEKKWI